MGVILVFEVHIREARRFESCWAHLSVTLAW
jgi:hypothetical protein